MVRRACQCTAVLRQHLWEKVFFEPKRRITFHRKTKPLGVALSHLQGGKLRGATTRLQQCSRRSAAPEVGATVLLPL